MAPFSPDCLHPEKNHRRLRGKYADQAEYLKYANPYNFTALALAALLFLVLEVLESGASNKSERDALARRLSMTSSECPCLSHSSRKERRSE